MHKRVIYIFTFILLFCTFASGMAQLQQQNPKLKRGETIYYDAEIEMTIAPCNNVIDLLYFPMPKSSLKTIAEKNNFKYVINGAYYYKSRDKAKPAGWYNDQGVVSGKLSRNKAFSHIVQFDLTTREFKFIPLKFFNPKKRFSVLEFQAGPMIIENNKVINLSDMHFRNHEGQYIRTLFAVKDKKQAYFITIRTPVSLEEAAERILKADFCRKGSINVVSLESGRGVAFYSSDHPEYNFNEGDALPILIGVKK